MVFMRLKYECVSFYAVKYILYSMVIYIGADHRGFALKEELKKFLRSLGYEVVDLGNAAYDSGDDYPDFAYSVAKRVTGDLENSRGILICGSGVGVDIAANKFPGARSALVASPDQAYDSRNDDDVNILSLAANYLNAEAAKRIVATWLSTPFGREERFRRRLQKIEAIEIELTGAPRNSSEIKPQ